MGPYPETREMAIVPQEHLYVVSSGLVVVSDPGASEGLGEGSMKHQILAPELQPMENCQK